MKRVFLFISIIFLAFLSAGFTVPERLTIVELNTETLTVGNRELKIGESFNSDQTIYWKSSKQAAEVQDNAGQLYIFTKEAFEQKKVKTPKEYLLTGEFSTRSSFDSPKIGRNKSYFPEKRVAMVIGNSNYVSRADFLRAPIADAGIVSEKLLELGFDTYTICDASSSDLFKAVEKFSKAASKYDIALFYYAGHGFCYNHDNYYQPIDVSDIDYETVHRCLKASELMRELSDKAAKGTILVMDACRSVAKVRGEDIFAPMEARPGMMLICSTSDGKAAIDAIGEYSPFAKAFSDNISIEGRPLYVVALETRNDVREITSGVQSPSFSDNLYNNFVFLPREEPMVATSGVPNIQEQKETPKPDNTVRFYPQVEFDLEHDITIEAMGAATGFKYGIYSGSTILGYTGNIKGIGSRNYHMADSYAWAKLSFTLPRAGKLVIECANNGEGRYDYGLISQIDQELSKSTTPDQSSNILKKSFSGQQTVEDVVYENVSAGRHFVTVKYRKDSTSDFGMDRFVITSIKLVGDNEVLLENMMNVDTSNPNYIHVSGNDQQDSIMSVDLGLSVKWATCNVGASRPEEYGGFYQWAGLEDVSSTSIYLDDVSSYTKYVPTDKSIFWSGNGSPDNKTVLEPSDDVVHVKLGGKWRMPTYSEWVELMSCCTWIWTTQNGVNGYKVTSKKSGFTGQSIFLPAAGIRYHDKLSSVGGKGQYWSSSLYTEHPHDAYSISFIPDKINRNRACRFFGFSVRPVLE